MTAEPILSPALGALDGLRHGFFTRRGGASGGVYASLNAGPGSGDAPEAVRENRARAARALGGSPDRLLTAYQVHSAVAHVVDAPWAAPPEGDAIVTRARSLICGALTADCAPVLIADPVAGVIASAHAGWKGAVGGVLEAAVAAMTGLGARPGRMIAAVGPCIGPASYEVGPDFQDQVTARHPGSERHFAPGKGDRRLFDLPGFVLERLSAAGVGSADWIGRDTFAEPEVFYSFRRTTHARETDYGRLLSAIVLE